MRPTDLQIISHATTHPHPRGGALWLFRLDLDKARQDKTYQMFKGALRVEFEILRLDVRVPDDDSGSTVVACGCEQESDTWFSLTDKDIGTWVPWDVNGDKVDLPPNKADMITNIAVQSHLSQEELDLIIRQCDLQGATTLKQINGFAEAYFCAKQVSHNTAYPQWKISTLLFFIRELGFSCEGVRIWRRVPVVFSNGNSGAPHESIDRLMVMWGEAFLAGEMSPTELYTEFEKIHPFVDGNGRVGHLLWAMAVERESGVWPVQLPPDVFR